MEAPKKVRRTSDVCEASQTSFPLSNAITPPARQRESAAEHKQRADDVDQRCARAAGVGERGAGFVLDRVLLVIA